jgi:hypothetical protein
LREEFWIEDAERQAEKIRAQAGIIGRIPPDVIAKRLGFSLKSKPLEDGLYAYLLPNRKRIVLSENHPEKRDFSIAHELAESSLKTKLPPDFHEAYCDRVAAAILLPRSEFMRSFFLCSGEIPRMRWTDWPWASWETLAMRVSDLLPGVFAAAWADEKVKWRSHHTRDQVTDAEKAAAKAARGRFSRGLVAISGRLAIAWRVPGRGILFRAVSLCLPMMRY